MTIIAANIGINQLSHLLSLDVFRYSRCTDCYADSAYFTLWSSESNACDLQCTQRVRGRRLITDYLNCVKGFIGLHKWLVLLKLVLGGGTSILGFAGQFEPEFYSLFSVVVHINTVMLGSLWHCYVIIPDHLFRKFINLNFVNNSVLKFTWQNDRIHHKQQTSFNEQ